MIKKIKHILTILIPSRIFKLTWRLLMPEMLKKNDKNIVELASGSGRIFIAPGLQGRIFCSLGDELIHRFDAKLAFSPHPEEFNNIGGNSLWPAPEGGDFAFNYLPGTGWLVQKGINSACPVVTGSDKTSATVEKNIVLKNRKGISAGIRSSRNVRIKDISNILSGYGLEGIAYRTDDSLVLLDQVSQADFMIGAWSLEQFPLHDDIIAFGRSACPAAGCINDDFYGDASARLAYDSNIFRFKLGGTDRLQIGIKKSFGPQLIGSYDKSRSLLIIRRTVLQDGIYFNIADNDQKQGPFSAADAYSIFNGGSLGFYELETIAPMIVENGLVKGSRLASETLILRGDANRLSAFLSSPEIQVSAEQIIN